MQTRTGFTMEQKYRHAGIALLHSEKLIGTSNRKHVLLSYMVHSDSPLGGLDECGDGQAPGRSSRSSLRADFGLSENETKNGRLFEMRFAPAN